MKKCLFIIAFLSGSAVVGAQSLEEGEKQLYYERYESAENTFRQLVQQQPANAAAWNGLMTTYLLQDKEEEALNTIRTAPASLVNEPFYEAAYGYVLLHEGKNDSASLYFNRALDQTREKDATLLASIAAAHIDAKSGDAAYAIGLLEKAIKREKRDARLSVLLGDAYRKAGNGSEAYKAYKDAIDKDSKYAAAYHRIGEIFVSQKNKEVYLDYFNQAIASDPAYAPAHYRLYAHEFYYNPAKAMQHYQAYAANSDPSIKNSYDLADLLYIGKQYDQAIAKADEVLKAEGDKVQPRLYKLIGYSHAELKDTAKALSFMQQYFEKEADSNIVSRDYASLAQFYGAAAGNDSLTALYYAKAVDLEKDSALLRSYYRELSALASANKDFSSMGKWLGLYYNGNEKATNLDLFNWGIAHYRAGEYGLADSVFGLYVAKYPGQSFGYYWQAKSQSLQDKEMEQGLAIPTYQKLVEVLAQNPSDANYKNWMVEAYSYLAAYEANNQKDYAEAVDYFEKLLEVDPGNESAKKYIAILEKDVKDSSK